MRLVPVDTEAPSAPTLLAFVEPLPRGGPPPEARPDGPAYERIAHQLPIPWALKGDGLEILDCNQPFLDKLGLCRAALIGRRIGVAVPAGLARELEIHDRTPSSGRRRPGSTTSWTSRAARGRSSA